MEKYKERFLEEYEQLTVRLSKLNHMITRYQAGKLDFEPTCPVKLLVDQHRAMAEYKSTLKQRAELEGLDNEIKAIDGKVEFDAKLAKLNDALVDFVLFIDNAYGVSCGISVKIIKEKTHSINDGWMRDADGEWIALEDAFEVPDFGDLIINAEPGNVIFGVKPE